MERPKLAIVWGAICGGCDVSIVNVGESLAKLLDSFDIVYWNVAVDNKLEKLKSLDKIDVAIYMGNIRTEEHLALAEMLKKKAVLIVAYGTCAVYGGIPGLAALIRPEELLEVARSTVTAKPVEKLKELPKELKIPELLATCNPLTEILEPDILVPGCPPPPESVEKLIDMLTSYLKGVRPPKATFIADSESLCNKCPRKPADLSKIVMPKISRLHEIRIAGDKCFLEQGILCLGPITRGGCDHRCIKSNMPCIGCMGPLQEVDDVGLKFLSSIASILAVDKERELLEGGLAKLLDKIIDPQGYFYRFTLPRSYLTKLALKRLER